MLRSLILALSLFGCSSIYAQHDGFSPITEETNLWGAWAAVEGEETFIQPIQDPDSPGGYMLVLHDDVNYFSSWVDEEMGASIDLQFTYKLEGNTLKCVFTNSNALGYFMQHENEEFSFKLFVSDSENTLLIELLDGKTYVLKKSTKDE